MFDQRGCGNSKPYGEVSQNSTQDLIEDIKSYKWLVSLLKEYDLKASFACETPYLSHNGRPTAPAISDVIEDASDQLTILDLSLL
jgi:hypothetical protein